MKEEKKEEEKKEEEKKEEEKKEEKKKKEDAFKNPLSIVDAGPTPPLKELMAAKGIQPTAIAAGSPGEKKNEETKNDDDGLLDPEVMGLLNSLDIGSAVSSTKDDGKKNKNKSGGGMEGGEGGRASPRSMEETPRCQGYMYKQGHHWHSWKRRWFVLRLSRLEYVVEILNFFLSQIFFSPILC